MPLRKQWRDFKRAAVAQAPDRPGIYELGDADGKVRTVGSGVLQDELKTALAYESADQVRWEATHTLEEAENRAAEHRARAGFEE
ncbi:DUF7508 domain-containing protein [Natronosalvus halobius]|uniref:DUF7508 domain-containing protein n=1 Tax=Natronosalvus halobius TaxID=2953746 RepID=UPI0020A1F7BE|nr:hypothetical protein [Natronosalvus halobius]USZ72565.1 hypothetical protein NGM15_04420 [Natronosalvus halobius]